MRISRCLVACLLGTVLFGVGLDPAHSRRPAEPPILEALRLQVEVQRLYEQGRYGAALPLAERALKTRAEAVTCRSVLC